MAMIDLNLGRLGNPISDGLNQIQAARERQKQMDMERTKLLMQQQNQAADNERANAFLKLQQDQFARSGKNEDEARQRQGAEDFQKIYHASGQDPKMARELAKAYGYEIIDTPNGPQAHQVAQPAQGAKPPQFSDSLMTPPGMGSDNGISQASDVPPPQGPVPGVPAITPGAGAPQTGAPGAPATTDSFPGAAGPASAQPPPFVQGNSTQTQPPAPPPPQPTEAQVTAQADKLNPILAAFKMQKGGRTFEIDPNAAKAAEEAAFAEQLKLKQAAPEARMAAAAIEAEKQRQFKEAEDAKYKGPALTFDQRKTLADISANGRVRAAQVSALSPLKIDAANRQDMGTLRQNFADWRKDVTSNIDSQSYRRLKTAMQNLDSTNPARQKEGAESLVSFFKGGGQVTKASQDLLLKHISGLVGDAQSWLEGLATGGYGSREIGVLRGAAHGGMDEMKDRLNEQFQSANDRFGPGNGFENMGSNVNQMVKSHFRQFDMEAPDIYQSETAPTVTLGSGSRPKPKANPIVTAKKTQNLQPQDKAAVDWANAHPNDPRSAAILKANGL